MLICSQSKYLSVILLNILIANWNSSKGQNEKKRVILEHITLNSSNFPVGMVAGVIAAANECSVNSVVFIGEFLSSEVVF